MRKGCGGWVKLKRAELEFESERGECESRGRGDVTHVTPIFTQRLTSNLARTRIANFQYEWVTCGMWHVHEGPASRVMLNLNDTEEE